MPGFDGTGPMGRGAMTGGGRGYCVVALNDESVMPLNGRGAQGRGRGRGFRNCFYATGVPGWMRAQQGFQAFGNFPTQASKEDDLATLKNKAAHLKEELEAIQARVQALEAK